MTSWRQFAVGALVLPIAFPAAAQEGAEAQGELARAAPNAREYCLKRAEKRRDFALLQCLRYRERYPLREWQPMDPSKNFGVMSGDRPDPPMRYFPEANPPLRFANASMAEVERCRRMNLPAWERHEAMLREGRALMEYRLRVLEMEPEQIAAEQVRVRTARPMSDDPELAKRLPYFLQFAREVAEGKRAYGHARDDLEPAVRSAIKRWGEAGAALQAAMERCLSPAAAPPPPPLSPAPKLAVGWAGTYQDSNSRYTVSGGAGSINVSYRSIKPGLNQSGSVSCIVTGNRAECRGGGNYSDSDKDIAYTETWSVTLSGDTISGTWKLPQATPSWKIANPGYTPFLHTGNGGSFSITRVK